MKRSFLVVMLMLTLVLSLSAEVVRVGNSDNQVNLIASDASETVIEMSLGYFNKSEVLINGQVFNHISLDKEAETYIKGAPEVPTVSRSIIIDNHAKPEMRIIDSDYVEYQVAVAPSKGVITRDIDPATVPYVFGEIYQQDNFFPQEISTLGSAYIMRNHRGVTVTFNPFQYNPTTNILRVYTNIRVAVANTGKAGENILTRSVKNVESFDFIYKNHFLNYQENRYDPLDEFGTILVIAPQNYFSTMQLYVDWKNQKGISTEMVDVATIGNNANSIKNYIQNYYDTHDDLAFVQIAGDAPQVATLSSGGGGADPMYALVAGNDSYPDIFIGRFSAENVDQLATQVERTIAYERDENGTNDYLTKATGIASGEGGGSQGDMGESDITHMNLIRDDLLGYNYTVVDQIYAPSANTTHVANAVNEGRGFMNYVGHGSNTTWVTTGFSNSHVNNLTNVGKLPFIVSVACVNGNFVSNTCFAEAWLRATHNGSPAGAMVMYASTINQSWNSPMRGQDEITDLLTGEELSTIGGLYYSGSCEMMDSYGSDGIDMYETWHIFGDASLQVRTNTPDEFSLNHTGILFVGTSEYTVNTGQENSLVALSYNNELLGSGYTDAMGNVTLNLENLPVNPVDLTLTVTGFNKITTVELVSITPAEGSYVVIDNLPITETHIGYEGNFTFDIKNVGVETSSDLTITLASDQAGLVIENNQVTVESISADQVISLPADAFTISIPHNIENNYMIPFTVNIDADQAANQWEYEIYLVNHAPELTIGQVEATEVLGNGNQRMDAGETFMLSLPIENIGGYVAALTNVSIECPAGLVVANNNNIQIEDLETNDNQEVSFEVMLSSQIPSGQELIFDITAQYGSLSTSSQYSAFVGLAVDDFESQSLEAFGWTTVGDFTFSDNAYEGQYSLKSADIPNSGTTSASVEFNSPVAGEISFWLHVSTESNYDWVDFKINGQQLLHLSGEVAWDEYTFEVPAGNNVFEWKYTKDYMVEDNDDCFYLDYVTFPGGSGQAPGAPVIAITTEEYNFGEILVGESAQLPITFTNSGESAGIVTIQIQDPFFIMNDNEELVSSLNFSILPDQEIEHNLVFAPSRDQEFSSQATISTDDPDNNEIIIYLAGIANPVSNDNQAIPAVTTLKGNYPNPFNPETTISFGMNKAGRVDLVIYNILGQKVKTLLSEERQAGNHQVVWNGKDANNSSVASGVYFYKMTTGDYSKTSKMILMK
jgi:hypothetical protein